MEKEQPASWSILHMVMLKFVMVHRVASSLSFVCVGVRVADHLQFKQHALVTHSTSNSI